MIIALGSKNPVKGAAVVETINAFSFLDDAQILTFATASGVADQPKSLEEIVQGAKNRARGAALAASSYATPRYQCSYGVGIESGIFSVPSNTGWMDTCACVIFDCESEECSYGLASSWETRKDLIEFVLEQNMNLDQASKAAGLTGEDHLGRSEGLSGLLSKGRLNRKEHTKEAVRNALIYLERTRGEKSNK